MNLTPLKIDIIIAVIILILLIFMISSHRTLGYYASRTNDGIDINDLIHKVKSELQKAEEDRVNSGKAALFQVNSFDLEIDFLIRTRYTQGGKVEYEFVAVSGENEFTSEKTQKITLHMSTIPSQEEKQKASRTQPDIAPQNVITTTPIPNKQQ